MQCNDVRPEKHCVGSEQAARALLSLGQFAALSGYALLSLSARVERPSGRDRIGSGCAVSRPVARESSTWGAVHRPLQCA